MAQPCLSWRLFADYCSSPAFSQMVSMPMNIVAQPCLSWRLFADYYSGPAFSQMVSIPINIVAQPCLSWRLFADYYSGPAFSQMVSMPMNIVAQPCLSWRLFADYYSGPALSHLASSYQLIAWFVMHDSGNVIFYFTFISNLRESCKRVFFEELPSLSPSPNIIRGMRYRCAWT